jgi:hypothetical protein
MNRRYESIASRYCSAPNSASARRSSASTAYFEYGNRDLMKPKYFEAAIQSCRSSSFIPLS